MDGVTGNFKHVIEQSVLQLSALGTLASGTAAALQKSIS